MLTYEQITDIAKNSDWQSLNGEIEGDFLDCKSQIYDLSLESQKIELAKDVSSFANAGGGHIIICIKTKKNLTHYSDEIVSFSPFETNFFDTSQYYAILNEWIYPKLENLQIIWKPENTGSIKGFGIISIPPQPETKRPFLISKTILASGRRRDILVGYAQRKRDISEPATIAELHTYFRDGMNYQNKISNQLAEIASRLPLAQEQPHFPTEEITERVKKNLEATSLNERKHFLLAVYPDEPVILPSLFGSTSNSISHILKEPPTIREYAFALTTLDTPKIIEGEFMRVKNGSRKVIDLYSDGVLIFGCAADDDFLAFGVRDFEKRPVLNVVALIEATYHFCLLYAEVLARLSPKPKDLHFRFQFGNVGPKDNKPAVFLPDPRYFDSMYTAPKDSVVKEIKIPTADFDPSIVAHTILENIYRWFGIESDIEIPFSEEVNGKRAISAVQIRALR